MKALSDYLHSRRLFFGFYSTLYYTSCAFVYPGSRSSELLDVMTFANDWDIDYLKLDGCNPDYSPTGLGYYQYGYADAGRALSLFKNATGKSITYSCSWPAYLPPDETTKGIYPAMIADGCNLWRNYDDIQPYWSSLSNIIEHWGTYGQFLKQFSGPTTISDADMLIVGEPGITDDEGRTQMAIWSIIMSPLLISADVRNISDTAKAILLNQEALAVNRDTRYEMGYRVMNDLQTGGQAWARNMSDGSVAFALYNSGSAAPLNVSVPFKSLNASWAPGSGLSYRVRDIWAQQDIGIFNSLNFTGSLIPPHGTGFYRAWASS
jgi:alpha-N-acetylgalactosaminidase